MNSVFIWPTANESLVDKVSCRVFSYVENFFTRWKYLQQATARHFGIIIYKLVYVDSFPLTIPSYFITNVSFIISG